jgi:tetratricopeptide (TPR) repeat protein
VLRGREFLSHATREDNDEAAALFQRAIDLDPNYAAAYAALGGSHYEAVTSGWTEFGRAEMEQAETLGQKALALDPTITSAYRLLARINLYRRLYELALGQIDRALEINPADAENYELRGIVLVWAGRPAEAVSWLDTALRFDGANTTPVNMCVAYYLLGRYGEAVQACDRALARNQGRFMQSIVHPVLTAVYAQMGRDQDGQRERTIVLRLWPFFDAGRFAAQFGTQEVRDQMLAGLKKAGFH